MTSSAVRELPRGSPCRRVPRPRWRSGPGSGPRHGRPTGRRASSSGPPPRRWRSVTFACWHDGIDQEGDVREELARGRRPRAARRSTRPSESSPLTCSSVIASCRRATSRLRSSRGAGKRLACSWTLIRAPVSEFLSWWARPAASWARSRVRSDCWMVRLISLSWTHIELIERARSATSSRPRPGSSSSKSPSAMRATCRSTSPDPPADAVGDPARDGGHEHERAAAEQQGGHRRLPPAPAASWSRGRGPAATSRVGRPTSGAAPRSSGRRPGARPGDSPSDSRRAVCRMDASGGGVSARPEKLDLRDPAVLRIGDELGPGEAPHPGRGRPRV